jgi:hypothetical protein
MSEMKLASTFSLGVALAIGTVSVVGVAPAFAKTEKPAAAPSFKMSAPFRAAVGAAQEALKKGDTAGASTKLDAADLIATAPDEKYVAGAVRLELAGKLQNPQMQGKALEIMLNSGSTPAADVPKFNFYLGQFAYQAANYSKSLSYFTAADQGGYKGANQTDMLLLMAESNFKLNQPAAGFPFIERAIAVQTAAGQKAPESWFARAASVAYKAKLTNDVAKWTRAQVKSYPTAENWRSALVTYRDGAHLEGNASLDVMRLMRLTKSLAGERDFFEYASLATERALPGEAKSAIEEGFASGAVSRSSRAVNEMLTLATGKIATDRASLLASEKTAAGAATGKAAKGTADGFLGYGEDAKAISLYQTALKKGGVDADEVNTRLGIALARSGQKDSARAAFNAVTGSRADIAKYWLLWLDLPAA